MKKIYSFVFAAVALFTAASCQKELVNAPEVNGEPFSFTATIGAETKTALAEDGLNIKWVLGDKVELFDADNNPVIFEAVEIMENGSALFQASSYNVPADGAVKAVYNNPEKPGVAFIEGSVVGNLHIGGGHTAVAKGYDPRFGILFGQGNVVDGELSINFNNVNSLIKFTIAGEAPNSITLACNGERSIAGLFAYDFENDKCTQVNPADGKIYGGSTEITLTPATGESFVSGETYYIPFIAGGNVGSGFSLKFDGTTVINTGETIENIPHNKIYNLGTVEMPEPKPEPADGLTVERVWNLSSENGTPWQSVLGFSQNEARNIAMDDEYIYVTSSNATTPMIKAISIADKSVIKDVCVEGIAGGVHVTSCCKVIKNTDPTINDGKDVLFVSNLASGEAVKLYAYLDGIDNAPTLYVLNNFRRYGDKFTYEGTLQEGEIRFLDQAKTGAVGRYPVKDGKINTWLNGAGWDPSARFGVPTYGGIGEVVTYPGSLTYALYTTQSNGKFLTLNGTEHTEMAWNTDPDLDLTYGYTFFDYNDKKYIAYARINGSKANGSLEIIEDKGTAEEFQSSLEAQSNLISKPVLDADSPLTAGSNVCACAVHEGTDGNLYAVVCVNDCGLALYRIK